MSACDSDLNFYFTCVQEGASNEVINHAFEQYSRSRSTLLNSYSENDNKKWKFIRDSKDSKLIWNSLSWNGKFSDNNTNDHIDRNNFKNYYEEIYNSNINHFDDISSLTSQVSIPVLDDPISEQEMMNAIKSCKKGGSDLSIESLRIFLNHFSYSFLVLLNMIF